MRVYIMLFIMCFLFSGCIYNNSYSKYTCDEACEQSKRDAEARRQKEQKELNDLAADIFNMHTRKDISTILGDSIKCDRITKWNLFLLPEARKILSMQYISSDKAWDNARLFTNTGLHMGVHPVEVYGVLPVSDGVYEIFFFACYKN